MTFTTQLPDIVLYYLLPREVYEHTDLEMLPVSYHHVLNMLCIFQVSLAILGCMYYGRWMPKQLNAVSPGYITIYQFLGLLVFHGGFYVFEMLITRMTENYFNMTIHHTVACVIFFLHFIEPNIICVVDLLPFLMHAFFWINGATDFVLLSLYNWVFLFVGITGIFTSVTNGSISARLPVLSIIEVGVNMYTYCSDFNGYYCPSTSGLSRFYKRGSLLAFAIACTLLMLKAVFYLSHQYKKSNSLSAKGGDYTEHIEGGKAKDKKVDGDNVFRSVFNIIMKRAAKANTSKWD